MSVILEKELHSQIETHKNQVNFLEEELKDSTKKHKRHKLILFVILIILALLLLLSSIMYFVKPEFLVNKKKLEQEGTIVLSSQEYEQLLESEIEKAREGFVQENQNTIEEASMSDLIIYAVQIGAFQEKEIQVYSENLIQFKEIYNEDFYKYSIGVFETLEEAQKFRREVVQLGFDDAFIASYSNGERLKIEEAY